MFWKGGGMRQYRAQFWECLSLTYIDNASHHFAFLSGFCKAGSSGYSQHSFFLWFYCPTVMSSGDSIKGRFSAILFVAGSSHSCIRVPHWFYPLEICQFYCFSSQWWQGKKWGASYDVRASNMPNRRALPQFFPEYNLGPPCLWTTISWVGLWNFHFLGTFFLKCYMTISTLWVSLLQHL